MEPGATRRGQRLAACAPDPNARGALEITTRALAARLGLGRVGPRLVSRHLRQSRHGRWMGNALSTTSEMAWQCSGVSNAELVSNMKRAGIIRSPQVEQAMRLADRGHFACDAANLYTDAPHPIGFGATISAPHMHAYCLEMLLPFLRPGATVLDVGSGSGYLTACLAHIVGPEGRVHGIDHVMELVEQARDCPHLLESGRARFHVGDGRLGLREHAPYDCIHVGAAAKGVPAALKAQLAVGGSLVIPVEGADGNQEVVQIERVGESEFRERRVMPVRYIPLCDVGEQVQGRSCIA